LLTTRMALIQKALDKLNYKVAHYDTVIRETEDQLTRQERTT
jgi:uncharacterized coiled-coil protein SlyX